MGAGVESVSERPLVYAVVFAPEDGESDPMAYSPFTSEQLGVETDLIIPHGLSRKVASALPGLWYCIHLPNRLTELIDIPAWMLKRAQNLNLGHHILLVPINLFSEEYCAQFLNGRH